MTAASERSRSFPSSPAAIRAVLESCAPSRRTPGSPIMSQAPRSCYTRPARLATLDLHVRGPRRRPPSARGRAPEIGATGQRFQTSESIKSPAAEVRLSEGVSPDSGLFRRRPGCPTLLRAQAERGRGAAVDPLCLATKPGRPGRRPAQERANDARLPRFPGDRHGRGGNLRHAPRSPPPSASPSSSRGSAR